jgi:hypothetical protein
MGDPVRGRHTRGFGKAVQIVSPTATETMMVPTKNIQPGHPVVTGPAAHLPSADVTLSSNRRYDERASRGVS